MYNVLEQVLTATKQASACLPREVKRLATPLNYQVLKEGGVGPRRVGSANLRVPLVTEHLPSLNQPP